ncbi:hypothetical protein Plhal304r1_c031g0101731 [Plasmopara halstedii]
MVGRNSIKIPYVNLPSSKKGSGNGSAVQFAPTDDRVNFPSSKKGDSTNGNIVLFPAPKKNKGSGSGSVPFMQKNPGRMSAVPALMADDGLTSVV